VHGSSGGCAIIPRPMDAAPHSEPALEVEDFGKTYSGAVAVASLSFTVAAGETLGLVGPNGAGKTTTLRSICGILPIEQGAIRVCGHDLATQERAAKSLLAWVPDDPQPFDALTVDEHLEFSAALYRLRDWRARADELLVRFELHERKDALGGELSRGMRQKLALCCAWLCEPRLLLLDEPLTGLDPLGILRAKQAIRELAARGTAVILSSHQLELVSELAQRLLILDHGRAVFLGTLDEARQRVTAEQGSSLEQLFVALTGAGPAAAVAPEA
jgi:ABC-2 type transport system ATP-binding protein